MVRELDTFAKVVIANVSLTLGFVSTNMLGPATGFLLDFQPCVDVRFEKIMIALQNATLHGAVPSRTPCAGLSVLRGCTRYRSAVTLVVFDDTNTISPLEV